MPRAVHFDMTAEDPERAVKFYADVFDWKAQKWEGWGHALLATAWLQGQIPKRSRYSS
jgi:predicted enzyme related to lactoylglutathione lyase